MRLSVYQSDAYRTVIARLWKPAYPSDYRPGIFTNNEKATDHGKNEAHGDKDALKKAQPRISDWKKKLDAAQNKKEKALALKKIKKISQTAKRQGKGESHSQKGKR